MGVFLTSCPGGMDMSLPFAKRKGDFLQGEIFGWGERLGVVLSHREGSSEGLFHWERKTKGHSLVGKGQAAFSGGG